MECRLCGKNSEETELFDGIFEDKIDPICQKCSLIEDIPIIRKPRAEQFLASEERLSVRERMERMANPKKAIPKEHFIAHKNLAKLKFPSKREDHPELLENYDWILKTGRRRKKLSQTQLAEELIVPLQVIMDLESGKVPESFKEYIDKLESFLDVRVSKEDKNNLGFRRLDEEKEILRSVRERIEPTKKVNEKLRDEKDLDFTNKEKLKELTLNDVISLKRKKQREELLKTDESDVVGGDLDLIEG